MTRKPLVKIFAQTRPDLPLSGFSVSEDDSFDFAVTDETVYSPCDVAVFYGSYKPAVTTGKAGIKASIYANHRGPKIIVETGFTGRGVKRRGNWLKRVKTVLTRKGVAFAAVHNLHRIGIDGVFGDEADFCNQNSPPDRWERQSGDFGITLRPYRKTGRHVLLVGQVPNDASLRGISMVEWIGTNARAIRAVSDRPILVRLHPNTNLIHLEQMREAVRAIPELRLLPITMQPIARDLVDCWACVTHSSTASVDALIQGVPPICLSPANIAFRLCTNSVDEVERPREPERRQWFNDLAYAQWLPQEIAEGRPWWHLRPGIVARLREAGWDLAEAGNAGGSTR